MPGLTVMLRELSYVGTACVVWARTRVAAAMMTIAAERMLTVVFVAV